MFLFYDSNGYWNTIDSLAVFKQSNVKWEIIVKLQNIVDKNDVNISNLHYVTISTPKRFLYQST